MTSSGIISDGWEENEVYEVEQRLGKEMDEWEPEDYDYVSDNEDTLLPISTAMVEELASILGVDAVGEEEANQVANILYGSTDESTGELTRIKQLSGIDEGAKFESYLDSIMREESDLFNTDEESQSTSIQTLNQLIAQEFPAGVDGTNAIQSLQGVIDDQEFVDAIKQLGKVNPEMDIREFLKSYLEKHDEENGTDIASKINFDSTTPAPTEPAPAAPAEPVAAAPAPAVPAVPEAPAAPAAPAPVAEEKEDPPFDPDPPKKDNDKDQFGNTIKNKARHLAKKGMAAAIAKAKKAGATAETIVNFGSGEMSLGEAITKAGMDVEEFFEGTSKQNEVVEFVKSMYDETTGNFPKGETGVLLAVEKQFGEDAAKMAHSVISELSQVYESKRMRQLAGITENGLQKPQADVAEMFKRFNSMFR
jgi:hypothetical protein